MQNHNWIDSGSMGLAGLALQGEDARAASWLSLATANLADIAKAIGPISDGSWHEGIPYQAYGLSMAVPFWTALARAGTDYTDLASCAATVTFASRPASRKISSRAICPTATSSAGRPSRRRRSCATPAARFRDGEAEAAAQKWLAAEGTRTSLVGELWYEVFEYLWYDPTVAAVNVTALPLDSTFGDLQSSVLRSSWTAGDLTLAFKAMPYGGRFSWDRLKVGGDPGGHLAWGHDHNDDMSFWLYGSGTWLAPEAMGYDAGDNAGYADWANSTAFHNSLLVDGQGQLGDARVSDSEWNNPWFWERNAVPLPTASVADYALSGGRGAALFDPALGITRWDRLVVLSRHRYALVWDDIAATASHAYDWVCHFPDGAAPDGHGWVQGTAKSGQGLAVRVVSPPQWTAQVGTQTATLMWKFDPDAETSYVRVRPTVAAASQQFLAALVPVPSTNWAAKPAVTPLDSTNPGAGIVVAQSSAGLEERWIFSSQGASSKAAGDLSLTLGLVGMAARNNGVAARAFLVGPGTLSDQSGARHLLSTASGSSIEADLRGTTLVVTGQGIADFAAYAPGATQATLNGAAVQIATAGDTVSWPAPAATGGGVDAGTADAGHSIDAGAPADAGSASDAGAADAGTPDAGTIVGVGVPDAGVADAGAGDAGTSAPDAGVVADAGVPDAGPAADAGADADAGTVTSDAGVVDAGATDAGLVPQGADAGAATDAGSGTVSSTPPPAIPVNGGGCAGCGAGTNASSAGLLALLMALTRRRKSTPRKS